MNEQISSLRECHRLLAEHGVGAVNERGAWLAWSTELSSINAASIGKGDRFSRLEARKFRSWRQPHRFGLGNVKAAGTLALLNPIAEGRNPVFQCSAGDAEGPINKKGLPASGCGFHPVKAQGITNACG